MPMGEIIELNSKKKPKPKPSKAILASSLAKRSMKVQIDGSEIIVPLDRIENTILNNIVASQGRALIQENIKKYKDTEQIITPRELKDLIGAMKDMIDMSGMIFANGDLSDAPTQIKDAVADPGIDFSEIGTDDPDGSEPPAGERKEGEGEAKAPSV